MEEKQNNSQSNSSDKAKIIKKKKKLKYKNLNSKNWGIDFMKNEYKEIILSNSNHPEIM